MNQPPLHSPVDAAFRKWAELEGGDPENGDYLDDIAELLREAVLAFLRAAPQEELAAAINQAWYGTRSAGSVLGKRCAAAAVRALVAMAEAE